MSEFFSQASFMPHGHCYLWQPALLWLQVGTNMLIGLAYVAISITLWTLVRRVRDVPFPGIALMFGTFIIACGLTHFSDVWVIWHPDYWLDGGIRAVTAVASVATAAALPALIPQAAALARGAQAARKRGVELEHMLQELENVYERTRELEQLKTQFFANVSHELRTPITLILGPVQHMLAESRLRDDDRHRLQVVERSARMLLKQVNDLLDVARLEAGAAWPHYVQVDLAPRVRAMAAHFEALAAERRIDFDVSLDETIEAEVDVEKLERVVMNLLSNAFKFTPMGGRVRLALHTTDGGEWLALEVRDSGPGIPTRFRSAVFERFRQLDGGATRAFGGTGLGLAIAREMVELHGGTIAVDDAPEGGSRFLVRIPRRAPEGQRRTTPEPLPIGAATARGSSTPPPVEALVAAAAPAPEEPLTQAEPDAALVLVVEDHPDMNRFVCETLAPDYRTASAADGAQGLEQARALRPDLVVCDVMMPVLSGEELVTRMAQDPELSHVPVLVLTAKADGRLPARILESGALDFLAKPFSVAELRARVRNLVSVRRARRILEQALEDRSGTLEELAAELAGRRQELETALEAVRVARDQAERASQMKTNLLRLVSHELRAPLAVLQLQLDRFELDPAVALDAPRQEVLARIAEASRRLRRTIDGLIQHARIESGKLRVSPEPVSLETLADDVLREHAWEARRNEVELRRTPTGPLEPVHSDPRLLRIVLGNLVANAIKFAPGGKTEVALARDGEGRFRISVSDTGPGISAADRMRIFEPFQQVEQAAGKHVPGVGLGLSLVREIVDTLGGRIELESEPGRGSVFTVLLPPRRAEREDG